MSSAPPDEHWLDRLAVLQTRRQVLRAALAGAALTIIPFTGTRPARASRRGVRAATVDCAKGCEYANHLRTEDALNGCSKGADHGILASTALVLFVNPFQAIANTALSAAQFSLCQNQALLRQKAANWDCLKPGCPGFDPHDKQYGPCASCDRIKAMCCPESAIPSGYQCCICCDPKGNGCKAPPC
jgi:hypothetical protein